MLKVIFKILLLSVAKLRSLVSVILCNTHTSIGSVRIKGIKGLCRIMTLFTFLLNSIDILLRA